MKTWNTFKNWIVNNEQHTVCDLKEMTRIKFKITQGEKMRGCKAEDEAYEFYKRKEVREKYVKAEYPQETLEWKIILGRKFKGGVMKIISHLGT